MSEDSRDGREADSLIRGKAFEEATFGVFRPSVQISASSIGIEFNAPSFSPDFLIFPSPSPRLSPYSTPRETTNQAPFVFLQVVLSMNKSEAHHLESVPVQETSSSHGSDGKRMDGEEHVPFTAAEEKKLMRKSMCPRFPCKV